MHDILQNILYFFGRGFCHQFSERSLEAGGLFFGICARDTGLYLGFIVALLVLALGSALTKKRPPVIPPVWVVAVGIVLVVPMALDGASSYLGLRETSNLLRYVTGYLSGVGVAVLVGGGVLSLWGSVAEQQCPHLSQHQDQRQDQQQDQQQSPAVESGKRTTSLLPTFLLTLLVSLALGAAFYGAYPALGVAAPFMVLAAQWLAVALVVVLVVSTTKAAIKRRRAILIILCILAAGLVMAGMALIASGLNVLLPWYMHP